jgi:hypothetical protein
MAQTDTYPAISFEEARRRQSAEECATDVPDARRRISDRELAYWRKATARSQATQTAMEEAQAAYLKAHAARVSFATHLAECYGIDLNAEGIDEETGIIGPLVQPAETPED